jgi:uncharacterized membrane protein YqjE
MTGGVLDAARGFVERLLDLGRTRFELFGAELREELRHLAAGLLVGLGVLVLAALGLAFCGLALIFYVGEAYRVAAAIGVALFFFASAAFGAFFLRRVAAEKPRAFDSTISELERDLDAIRS